jgi:hypothetical protein
METLGVAGNRHSLGRSQLLLRRLAKLYFEAWWDILRVLILSIVALKGAN